MEQVESEPLIGRPVAPCSDAMHYVPDTAKLEYTPMRYVKVNFHIMQDRNGKGNFPEDIGKKYINELLRQANETLLKGNKKMNLPKGNNMDVLPTRYQYVLSPDPSRPGDDGIYFHRDDDMYYMINRGPDGNVFDRKIFKKHGVQKDDVLNVFVLTDHLDSLKSPTYKGGDRGVSMGSWVKVMGWWRMYEQNLAGPGQKPFYFREWHTQKLLNHEIGHSLGLAHSWVANDRCDDTPPHANCFNVGSPPCDVISNNVMDYNIHMNAWSPCQIGIIHKFFSTQGSMQRRFIVKDWCELDKSKSIYLTQDEVWNGSKDLYGHLTIGKGVTLEINCRVGLPAGARITLKKGAKLILGEFASLNNDCGEQWEGIITEEGAKVQCNGTPEFKDMKYPVEIKQ